MPIHFLVEDERLVGVVLDAGGCHVADLNVGGKTRLARLAATKLQRLIAAHEIVDIGSL